MNTKDFLGILLMAMLAVVGLTACSNDDEESRKVTDYKEYVLTVASEKIPGVLWSDGFNYLSEVIQTKSKAPEEMPESYTILPPDAQIAGYGEWTFLDEAEIPIDNLSFDVFMGYAAQTKDIDRAPTAIYLYKDLTGYYQTKYPEAGVKTVVVSYKLSAESL